MEKQQTKRCRRGLLLDACKEVGEIDISQASWRVEMWMTSAMIKAMSWMMVPAD